MCCYLIYSFALFNRVCVFVPSLLIPVFLHVQFVCVLFPQQRKLMGSSAQNSSGMHWCRRRVRFNEVPEKVPKVPEKVWEALVQSQVRFNRVPEKVPEKVWRRLRRRFWESLVQGQVRFNGFQRSEGSGEGCREGSGGACFFLFPESV